MDTKIAAIAVVTVRVAQTLVGWNIMSKPVLQMSDGFKKDMNTCSFDSVPNVVGKVEIMF